MASHLRGLFEAGKMELQRPHALFTPIADNNNDTPKSRKQLVPPTGSNKARVPELTKKEVGVMKPAAGPAAAEPRPTPVINAPPPVKDGTKYHHDNDALIEIPETILDTSHKRTFIRGRFLGKGGFARCYEVTDMKSKDVFACKVVSKSLLVKQHQREKMAQEISIHRDLEHEFIVKFHSFFEDDLNVYVILELCNKKSLMEMQKRRRILSEPEARYFIKQIMTGLTYLHGKKIIHRDLKLGNIFINEEMNLKLGDFGLATQCNTLSSKRFTLCGTPNYIAPEVLSKKGHSFEVDIWSTGCILYTLLLGNPPFETRSLKETYVKIRKGEFVIPTGKVSSSARNLISQMLQVDPTLRPSPKQILTSDFLTKSAIPKTLPLSVLTMPPRFIAQGKTGPEKIIPDSRPTLVEKHDNKESTPQDKPTQDCVKMKQLAAGHMKNLLVQMKNLMSAISSKRKAQFNNDSEDPNSAPVLWIAKWVDYSDKYGFGYQLSDDSIGVSFNDTSKMVLIPDNSNIQYIDRVAQEHFYARDRCPQDLQKKLKLLNYFQQYMSENLVKAGGHGQKPDYSMARLPSMWTWFRTSRAVVMVLTNGTLQINNFRDHTKTILCPLLSAISTLESNKPMMTYRFSYLESHGCTQELAERISYAIEKLEVVLGSKLDRPPPKLATELGELATASEAKENAGKPNKDVGVRDPKDGTKDK